MVRLTAELLSVAEAEAFVNTLGDRELDLRGRRIPMIENLGITRDQYDTITLVDNDITHLGNFPVLKQLRVLALANNRVRTLDQSLGQQLPRLHTLMLANNRIDSIDSIVSAIRSLDELAYLTLVGNPIVQTADYRQRLIAGAPRSLRVLDYTRITDMERRAAAERYPRSTSGASSSAKKQESAAEFAETAGSAEAHGCSGVIGFSGAVKRAGPSVKASAAEQQQRIRDAIRNAKTLAEIQALEAQLGRGGMALETVERHDESMETELHLDVDDDDEESQ